MSSPEADASATEPRSRRGRRFFLAYLILLLLSHGVRWLSGEPEPPTGREVVEVPAVADVETLDETIRLAYFEWSPEATSKDPPGMAGQDAAGANVGEGGPVASEAPPVILLVHGSPGDGANFRKLGPLLARGARVIAPDLPGFGASSRRIPDYSIRAHARYCLELLDRLGIERVHAVGFSLGGGVVLELQAMAPERVSSLVMLSATGVQELELLGQYHLNHALHGLQLVGFRLLLEGVPHFGLFDRATDAIPYARNFFDTDQRPLRAMLSAYEGPMLIVHGENDVLVPVAAAHEHHRIVPQSELSITPDNHFMVFLAPEKLLSIADFVDRVEAGVARRRADAESERVAASDPEGFRAPAIAGFALLITLVLLALSTLASEDLACIAAGLLVARGSLDLAAASLACGAGIFLGDLGLYALGRLGRPWLHRAPLRWVVKPRSVGRSERWFGHRGPVVIFLSRFTPGMRLPTYVAAGLLKMGFWRFTLSLLIPVALWTPLLVSAARYLGDGVFERFELFQRWALPGFAATLVSVWLTLALIRSLTSWRGRRGWVGWWKRQREWEFWPPWRFYPPVVLSILGLAWRYRSPTLFTAANPGMDAGGGFIGESKSEILSRLDPAWVARFELLPGSATGAERRSIVEDFRRHHGLTGPLVLKPDQGQRGEGVTIVRDDASLSTFLRTQRGDAIVQEYVAGPELGVFYVRLPGEARGEIFSITEKLLPTVLGDGHSTLEHLILADPRAVAVAPVYLERLADRLDEVPREGELVSLVDLGTHCRGAVFLDGGSYRSEAMEESFEAIARGYEGFYFGRFDVRAPSIEVLQEGRDFKILELNGVTSEATHIYDPKHTAAEARAVLREQWRLAYEIGHRNRQRGVEPIGLWGLLRLLVTFRRRG